MRKILVIILLAVSLFNLGKKSDFVPDDAFFLQVIEQYDTDISLSQYRFRIYEKSPKIRTHFTIMIMKLSDRQTSQDLFTASECSAAARQIRLSLRRYILTFCSK